ncbi:MAG: hypothetical protein GVY16_09550 [Planctomycetes bacterium]|nr:hypothetical protein [Planctomycetota bacterium]
MSEFWKIVAGPQNSLIRDFEESSCVAVGWTQMGDLTDIEGPEELELHFDNIYPDFNAKRRGLQLAGIQKFRFGMSPGDRVISYNPNTRDYLWGTITGDYQYNSALVPEYNNVRLVDWCIDTLDTSLLVENVETLMAS